MSRPIEHTPGPWEYEGTDLRSHFPFAVKAGADPVAKVEDFGTSGTPEANARLIAAAPELLEVCEMTLPYFDADSERGIAVAQAIAKAKGE